MRLPSLCLSSFHIFIFYAFLLNLFLLHSSRFEKALAATGSFQKRFTFIDHLDGMIHNNAQWAEWCENRREWAVQTLQAPAEEDVPILLKLINVTVDFCKNSKFFW